MQPLHTKICGAVTALCLLALSTAATAQTPVDFQLSEGASADSPQIFWTQFDYDARTLSLNGIHLIEGAAGSAIFPTVRIAGNVVAIDEQASEDGTDFVTFVGPLVIPFDNILDALPALVVTAPEGRTLPPEGIYVLTVDTSKGRDVFTAYFPQEITDITAPPPPPPPPSSEPCPCTSLYNTYYDSLFALLWPTCSTPESSNRPYAPVPPEQYIEATMIDELWIRTITIGSDSSASPRGSRAGTCYVLNGDTGGYLGGGPLPVSDAQHMGCVEDIYARESICRGCNWLDDC